MPDTADSRTDDAGAEHAAVLPRAFTSTRSGDATDPYLGEPSIRTLIEFFESKTLAAIKDEDRRELWYDDWMAHQAERGLYASVLSPGAHSTRGARFDLLRYARFLEVFAYCSPSHGYSAQVTFLGLFAILMGSNEALKREAVAVLERGGLLAFGVSEKAHGSDLLASEFLIRETGSGSYVANGSKYYIGNSNAAAMIAILAKQEGARAGGGKARAPFTLIALRPEDAPGYRDVRKIRTLGVRAAHVGELVVRNHELPASDVVAEGRRAWNAVLGAVTLGKFFLGFGSIGICEHAFAEATGHLRSRVLYGKPVIAMPHIRALAAQAYARLAAMKLYAYRALDYLQAAHAKDRRSLLFCAVQKAKVSTEGVKTVELLSECIGAKGFEADTYFEMALRDVRLIPGLEGSAHINLGLATQFGPRYFDRFDADLAEPGSLVAGAAGPDENPYLFEMRTTGLGAVAFPPYLDAYRPLAAIPNVGIFVEQAKSLRDFFQATCAARADADMRFTQALGQCLATVVYAQLIAENASRLQLAPALTSVIFHNLVSDVNSAALTLASLPQLDGPARDGLARVVMLPRTGQADWDAVAARL